MTKEKILYRLVPHNSGAVFASSERALFVAGLHKAIKRSSTWGQFAAAIPAEEYEEIVAKQFDAESMRRPSPSTRFSGEDLWGWSDGDYPPWLQSEMEWVIPDEILEQFGQRKQTFVNGPYWHIPEEQMEPMANALRKRGFDVEKAEDLPFH
jgi:hypothetical protein